MFNNFKVSEEHKDYLRFHWFADNNPREKIVQYRSNSHLFGCTSSPAVANFCLRYTAKNLTEDSLVKQYIEQSFYVDDGLSSANSVDAASDTLHGTIDELSKYNIRLHKVMASSEEVLATFPESEIAIGVHDFDNKQIQSQRTLGILWNPKKDVFKIAVNVPERRFTKRGILSVTNSLYDPFGFVAPVTLTARLIQRIILPPKSKTDSELEQYGWDDPLPTKYVRMWENWKHNLSALADLEIPRSYLPNDKVIGSERELHVFCDASNDAIGFVVYMKVVASDGSTYVSFILGGAKVAPRCANTTPRLELCAALECVIACNNVVKELQQKVQRIVFYSDSRIVLGYLFNTSRQFSNYVARRIKLILSLSNRNQWRYINTKENPADIGSRPHTPADLKRSIWLTGPIFLTENLPNPSEVVEEIIELPEAKAQYTSLSLQSRFESVSDHSDIVKLCERVNSWTRVCRYSMSTTFADSYTHMLYDSIDSIHFNPHGSSSTPNPHGSTSTQSTEAFSSPKHMASKINAICGPTEIAKQLM